VVEEPDFIRLDPTKESFININTPEELSLLYREKQNAPCDA
jgi:molybdopterin-guanine dinucleotide biosynthesis protein A